MNCSGDVLKQLQQQTAEKKRLEGKLRELYMQRTVLQKQVEKLEQEKLAEQADVDRLENHSLSALFYQMVGQLDEKLDKERQEAYAAWAKYDAAVRELDSVEAEIAVCEERAAQLQDCEQQYQEALQKKAAEIRSSGNAVAQELLRGEVRISELENRIKEIQEAVNTGETALHTAEGVLKTLDSAEGWSHWDILGGGLLVDAAKYNCLNNAQTQVEQLQEDLRRFKTELTDVTVEADLKVSIDGFLQFADFFFDGLFADLAVMEHINKSQERVEKTRNEIRSVLSRLAELRAAASAELDTERERTAQITVDTVL